MPRLPFPTGYEGSVKLPRTWTSLVNCWSNGKGQLIGRPGIFELNTADDSARGAFEWNGSPYQVFGTSLIKITNTTTGAFSTIGTIAGAQVIETAVGFTEAVIVARGGNIYTLDKSDVLTDISGNANIKPSVDVTAINQKFVYIPADGSPAFFSDVGDAGSVQVLSFFDAEELPDKNVASFNLGNTLYILGEQSIELFSDTGESPNPFQRIPRSRINVGFIGGMLDYGDSCTFIGRETNHDRGIYQVAGGRAQKISNERLDGLLSDYTIADLGNATPARYQWDGFDVLSWTLKNDSFGFVDGKWHILQSLENNEPKPWGGGYIMQCQGEYFTAFGQKIGKLQEINTDYGENIPRIIDMGFEDPEADWFACQRAELGISQGFNGSDASVAVFMSRDNVTYGQPVYRNMANIGQYGFKLIWDYPGGLGRYQGFMGLRLYTTENLHFAADHLILDIN